jgi:hypothetical protein
VAKFSPKSINVGTADNTSHQMNSKELHNGITTFVSADPLDKDALNPQPALL